MKNQQKYAILVGALVVLVMAVASGPAHATALNLISNGSFEKPLETGGTLASPDWSWSSGTPTDWTVSADYVGIANTASAYDGSQLLVLQYTGGQIGTIQQSFTTVVGQQYEVSFDYAVLSDGGGLTLPSPTWHTWNLTANIGGTSIPTLSMNETDYPVSTLTPWLTKTFFYTATSTSTILSFTGDFPTYAGHASGPVLDNVIVNEVIPVPEPATFVLLLVGGGLMFFRRRSAS